MPIHGHGTLVAGPQLWASWPRCPFEPCSPLFHRECFAVDREKDLAGTLIAAWGRKELMGHWLHAQQVGRAAISHCGQLVKLEID